jgi:TDG/mug DNA glycosylase family protein
MAPMTAFSAEFDTGYTRLELYNTRARGYIPSCITRCLARPMKANVEPHMPHVRSFAPVENANARILILGSMPGRASLQAGQYYAHPRNLFWRILGELLGVSPALPYERRIRALKAAHIALWDVLESCEREGSLDADIDDASLLPNDFASFFLRHPRITHVFFNGAKAEACYRTRVLPAVRLRPLQYHRLPSTSPAHASMSLEQKLKAWRVIATRGLIHSGTRRPATAKPLR